MNFVQLTIGVKSKYRDRLFILHAVRRDDNCQRLVLNPLTFKILFARYWKAL